MCARNSSWNYCQHHPHVFDTNMFASLVVNSKYQQQFRRDRAVLICVTALSLMYRMSICKDE